MTNVYETSIFGAEVVCATTHELPVSAMPNHELHPPLTAKYASVANDPKLVVLKFHNPVYGLAAEQTASPENAAANRWRRSCVTATLACPPQIEGANGGAHANVGDGGPARGPALAADSQDAPTAQPRPLADWCKPERGYFGDVRFVSRPVTYAPAPDQAALGLGENALARQMIEANMRAQQPIEMQFGSGKYASIQRTLRPILSAGPHHADG